LFLFKHGCIYKVAVALNGYSNFINCVKRQRNLGLGCALKSILSQCTITRPCNGLLTIHISMLKQKQVGILLFLPPSYFMSYSFNAIYKVAVAVQRYSNFINAVKRQRNLGLCTPELCIIQDLH
jgi:hypothetical protein